jgi:uncharacterized protein
MNTLTKIFLVLMALIVAVTILVQVQESRLWFRPSREIARVPADLRLPYEEVSLKSGIGLMVHGWFMKNNTTPLTVLFLEGLTGNRSDRLEKVAILYKLGVSVLLMDYRGFGGNDGQPTEKGIYDDADAAYRYLIEGRKIPADQVIVYGESVGATAAINLVSRYKVRALILEAAFSSSADMFRLSVPFLPAYLLSAKYDSLKLIPDINVPLLFIHSVDDEVIPVSLGRALFDAAWVDKRFCELSGGHATAFLESLDLYTEALYSFLSRFSDEVYPE